LQEKGPRYEGSAPSGRPCDFCWEPIYDGNFIHTECAIKEWDLWMDILY